MRHYGLTNLGMINALGENCAQICSALLRGHNGCSTSATLRTTGAQVPVGAIATPLPELPEELIRFNCRNHRIAYAALCQISDAVAALRARFGPQRIGVVLGSSTAGIDATERAFQKWLDEGRTSDEEDYCSLHSMGSVARFVAQAAGVCGPAYTLSTACTSGAKAMISARNLLDLDLCDAVITGGVDTLCELTLNGFEALGALAHDHSLPMSVNRRGLNIGEGAAFFIMTREPAPIQLLGAGESCDAWHMSAPHPEGLGAEACMRAALEDAGLQPGEVGYLNLHGTGTPQNDSMEARAVQRVFGTIPCSSTKPMVGHTLGAAGAIEAAFCWLALAPDRALTLPPHLYDGCDDPQLPRLDLVDPGRQLADGAPRVFLSNSFAFGGNNCSLILGRSGGAQ